MYLVKCLIMIMFKTSSKIPNNLKVGFGEELQTKSHTHTTAPQGLLLPLIPLPGLFFLHYFQYIVQLTLLNKIYSDHTLQ